MGADDDNIYFKLAIFNRVADVEKKKINILRFYEIFHISNTTYI